ncbi:MAG: NADP-dependent malic enzyme [Patescibacteria group bacterium]
MEIQELLKLHASSRGKIRTENKVSIDSKADLSAYYTPGIAAPCREISADPAKVYEYTMKGNSVAVVTDGSAVLGLGNIGPLAGMPVMEGKCALFRRLAGVDAWPICLSVHSVEEIVAAVKAIAPGFGGINLEDIAAPACFEIERRLQAELDIPVVHDDQHATAVVVLAGLVNALKVVGKSLESVRIAISGAGAAGIAIADLLLFAGVKDIVLVDRTGIVSKERTDLNSEKILMAERTNLSGISGSLADAMKGSDVFIGVSSAGLVTADMVRSMNERAIVFAMANPNPEIMPVDALAAGAMVAASGRSDLPNQLNNVLVFPGLFRGALDKRVRKLGNEIFLRAAYTLASLVEHPTAEKIIPDVFDERVATTIAGAVSEN